MPLPVLKVSPSTLAKIESMSPLELQRLGRRFFELLPETAAFEAAALTEDMISTAPGVLQGYPLPAGVELVPADKGVLIDSAGNSLAELQVEWLSSLAGPHASAKPEK